MKSKMAFMVDFYFYTNNYVFDSLCNVFVPLMIFCTGGKGDLSLCFIIFILNIILLWETNLAKKYFNGILEQLVSSFGSFQFVWV